MDFYRQLGARIRGFRLRAHLSQAALGAHLGRTAGAVNRYEMGERRVPLEDVPRLAAIFGVPPAALLGGGGGRRAEFQTPPRRRSGRADLHAEHLRLLRALDARLSGAASADRIREKPSVYPGTRTASARDESAAYARALSQARLRAVARRAGIGDAADPESIRRLALLIVRDFVRRHRRSDA